MGQQGETATCIDCRQPFPFVGNGLLAPICCPACECTRRTRIAEGERRDTAILMQPARTSRLYK